MLQDLEHELRKQSDLETDDLRKTASALLSKQFVYRVNGQDRNVFFAVKDSQEYFANLFNALGYKLVVADEFGYIGLIPEFSFRSMKLVDSLFLLVARLVFDEEMKNMRVAEDTVFISHESFLMRYEKLTGRDRPQNISKFHDSLATLQRYGVIKSKGSSLETGEPNLVIYPGIISLISAETTEQIADFNQISLTDEEAATL